MMNLESLFDEGEDATLDAFTPSELPQNRKTTKKVSFKSSTYYEKRPEEGHVGLLNQGATCYLNSLLQCLYMTPELRAKVYQLTPDVLNFELATLNQEQSKLSGEDTPETPKEFEESKSQEKEEVQNQEKPEEQTKVEQDEIFVSLAEMGFSESVVKHAKKKLPGVKDLSRLIEFCLTNADVTEETQSSSSNLEDVFPQDETQESFNDFSPIFEDLDNNYPTNQQNTEPTQVKVEPVEFVNGSSDKQEPAPSTSVPEKKVRKIPLELQRLFATLQLSDQRAISTELLTKSFGWHRSEALQQHDVHELNRILFDAIEKSLKNTPAETLITDLYRGTLVNKIVCLGCQNSSEREEYFQDVTLVVNGFQSLSESLQSFTTFELLSGDNKYECSKCKNMCDAKKGIVFRDFPPILILSLSRFEYDWQEDKRKKINDKFGYPLVIDMLPYCEKGNHLDQPHIATKPTTKKGKKERHYEIEQPIVDPNSPYLYELFGVVIHQGGAYGGHYHAYIRDILGEAEGRCLDSFINEEEKPTNESEDSNETDSDKKIGPSVEDILKEIDSTPGVWYNFDDSHVKRIPYQRLASQYAGGSECAYMLIYRKKTLNQSVRSIAPVVPEWFATEVDKQNRFLEEERQKYEKYMNELELTVLAPGYYTIIDGRLAERVSDSIESEHKKVLTVDKRGNLKDFKQQIKEMFPSLFDVNIKLLQLIYRDGKPHVYKYISDTQPEDTKITNIDIKEGSLLLAWNGIEINGIPWNGEGEEITVNVKYHKEDIIQEFSVQIKETSTLKELKYHLVCLTDLTLDSLSLFMVEQRSIRVFKEEQNGKSLFELGFVSPSHVVIERRNTSSLSKAKEEFYNSQETHIEVFITDFVSDEGNPSIKIDVLPDIRLFELKKKVLSILYPHINSLDVRLVRVFPGGVKGDPYGDETVTLEEAGIVDGSRVIIEKGAPPSDYLRLRFVLVFDGKKVSDTQEVTVHKRSTVYDCKTHMAALVCKDPEQFRLRKVDLAQEPADLFQDENATLEQEGLEDCDLVWLEEGKPPLKGQITIRFQMYSSVADAIGIVRQNESQSNVLSTFNGGLSSPALHLSPFWSRSSFDTFLLTPLFSLDVSFYITLADLKTQLIPHFEEFNVKSTSEIRIWFGEKLLRKDNATLKRLQIIEDTNLVVQIVSSSVEADNISDNSLLLYVHKRNPEFKSFDPPVELYFNETNFTDLRRVISTRLCIPEDQIIISKYIKYNDSWQILEENAVEDSQQGNNQPQAEEKKTKKQNKATKKSKEGDLRSKPYLLRDGDIIGIKNKLDDPENKDDFTVSKPRLIRKRKDEEEEAVFTKASSTKSRSYEPVLSITVDL